MKSVHLCFETLGNHLRMQILHALESGPKNVSQLATALEAERTRVSHALRVLKSCNFVTVQKAGKERIYAINHDSILFKTEKQGLFNILKEHKNNNCTSCCKLVK